MPGLVGYASTLTCAAWLGLVNVEAEVEKNNNIKNISGLSKGGLKVQSLNIP